MKKLNLLRYLIMVLAGFGFVFLYDMVVHSVLLMPLYDNTPDLWRDKNEMQDYASWMMFTQIMIVVATSFLYSRNHEDKGTGLGEGLRFGLILGLLISMSAMQSYAYMPISMLLALSWGLYGLIFGLGLGVIYGLIYQNPPVQKEKLDKEV